MAPNGWFCADGQGEPWWLGGSFWNDVDAVVLTVPDASSLVAVALVW